MSNIDHELLRKLIDAAVLDHDAARRLLAEHPELLNMRNSLGETALHFLAVENHADAVRWLAEAGGEVNCRNKFGATPLADAAFVGNNAMVSHLLALGADANATNETLGSVLAHAVRSGKADVVETLIHAGAKFQDGDVEPSLTLSSASAETQPVLEILRTHGLIGEQPEDLDE